MRIFKLRPELVGDPTGIVSLLIESFGQPNDLTINHATGFSCMWEIRRPSSWHPDGKFVDSAKIEIDYVSPNKIVNLYRSFMAEPGALPSVRPDTHPAPWEEMWDKFYLLAAKPWSAWTEDEIMESTMWCRYFLEDGGVPTETIHNMMVMKSYENPEDSHIKEYFNIWKLRSAEIRSKK